MKKLFTLILAAALLSTAALTGCGASKVEDDVSSALAELQSQLDDANSKLKDASSQLEKTEPETETETETETEPETEKPTKKPAEKPAEKPTENKSSEQVLFDNNGIKITYTGMSSSYLGPQIKLRIENNSDIEFTVQTRNCAVNGYMIDPVMSCDVGSGKKANTSMTFMDSYLEENGITTIESVELNFHMFNWDYDDRGFDTETISFNP